MNSQLQWKELTKSISIAHFNSVESDQKLYLKKWTNVTSDLKAKYTLFLCHDYCHNHHSFQDFIDWILMHLKEVEIVTYDYIGHGLSSGTRGHFDDFDNLVVDTLNIVNSLEINTKSTLIGLGHGLGGLILLDLYNRHSNNLKHRINLIGLTSFIINADKLPIDLKYNFVQNNKFVNRLKLSEFYHASELTHQPEKALYFAQDPLIIHRPTLGSIFEIKVKSKNIYQDAYFLDIPVFVGWSENDKYIYHPGMNYFLKGVKKDLLSEKRYSLMKHDLYNEIDSLTFYEDLLTWIKNNE